MRTSYVATSIVSAILFAVVGHGQTESKTGPQPLSENFVRAALKALITVGHEPGWATYSGDGQASVPKQTQESIDNTDVEARSSGEREIVVMLGRLFHLKMVINVDRNQLLTATIGIDESSGKFRAMSAEEDQRRASTDPDLLKMEAEQTSCSAALDALLRGSTFAKPPEECSKSSLRQIPIASQGGMRVNDKVLD